LDGQTRAALIAKH